jgi:hypothetical protein
MSSKNDRPVSDLEEQRVSWCHDGGTEGRGELSHGHGEFLTGRMDLLANIVTPTANVRSLQHLAGTMSFEVVGHVVRDHSAGDRRPLASMNGAASAIRDTGEQHRV